MTRQISLVLGSEPWKPSTDTRMVVELNRWDVPTEGVLKQRFRRRYFLFRCMAGATGQYSAWAYVPITAAEVKSLRGLTGPTLGAAINKIMLGTSFTMALAEEGRGIVHGFEGRMERNSGKPTISQAAVEAAETEIRQEVGAMRHLLATC